jgi:serine/threonine-protein kinase RsbW
MLLASFDIEHSTQKVILDSSLRDITALDALLSSVKEQYAIKDESFDVIWLVLHEAVTNAIRHGNRCDLSKKVRLSIEAREQRFLCFTVKDEGEGFDPTSIPDPTSPENIAEPNGRGVFLINKLADKVHYSHNGTVVEVCFDLFKN